MLSQIETFLVDALGPMGPLLAVGMLGVLLILITLPSMLNARKDPLDKLNTIAKIAEPSEKLRSGNQSKDKLEKYSSFLEPQDEEEYSAVRLKLLQAGYRDKSSVRIYHFLQFLLGILFLIGGIGFAIYKSTTGDVETPKLMMFALGPGVVGYMLPKYWVTRRQTARQEAIVNAFPDSLDMMLVCVEAGQSMDQAILRVSHELKSGFPELAEEYEMVSHEMKAGKDKTQVLRDMSERCGVSDIASFVTVLIQSQQFGTSVADALRVYAGEMRDKRVMRAEEKANKLPTKMTLATMMLTVPPLLIILIGPSIYEISTILGSGGLQ